MGCPGPYVATIKALVEQRQHELCGTTDEVECANYLAAQAQPVVDQIRALACDNRPEDECVERLKAAALAVVGSACERELRNYCDPNALIAAIQGLVPPVPTNPDECKLPYLNPSNPATVQTCVWAWVEALPGGCMAMSAVRDVKTGVVPDETCAGPAPDTDSDRDGVRDADDWCPDQNGEGTAEGCPKYTEEDMAAAEAAGAACADDPSDCPDDPNSPPEEEDLENDTDLQDDGTGTLGIVDAASLISDPTTSGKHYFISTARRWATLRGSVNFLAVGLATNGWRLDPLGKKASSSVWGHLGETVHKCLWVNTRTLSSQSAGGNTTCSSDPAARHLPQSAYLSSWNGDMDAGPYQNCRYPVRNGRRHHECGGFVTTIGGGCPYGAYVFANVRPWVSGADANNQLYSIPAGATISWRYVTKDGRWAMIRDNSHQGPDRRSTRTFNQAWGFIATQCVASFGYSKGPDS